jgi:hypothetical protein
MGFIENDPIWVIGFILTKIAELFFSHNHTYGWIDKSMFVPCNLFFSWKILSKELLGFNGGPLKHVSSQYNFHNDEALDYSMDL